MYPAFTQLMGITSQLSDDKQKIIIIYHLSPEKAN